MTAALPDGRVIRTVRPVVKNFGYNLTKLFVGSCGTLGLIADVTLDLSPTAAHSGDYRGSLRLPGTRPDLWRGLAAHLPSGFGSGLVPSLEFLASRLPMGWSIPPRV